MKATNKIGSMFLRYILLRMKELGVLQTELAKRMNASRSYVVKVLHGEVNIALASAPLLGHRFATRVHLGEYSRFAKALQLDFLPVLRDETGDGMAKLCQSMQSRSRDMRIRLPLTSSVAEGQL